MTRAVAIALGLAILVCSVDARGAPPPKPKKPSITIGDALDIRAPESYLGKNWQAVSVITPLSANRRQLTHDTKQFVGMRRRRGMVIWLKKREGWPFEKLARKPFTLRFLRHDPAGIALSMAQEGLVELREEVSDGKRVVSLSMAKPNKPWYRRLF